MRRTALLFDPPRRASHQQPLISTWVVTPLDWIQMHPKSVPLSFLDGKKSYKQLPMGIAGSLDIF
jgi:hypothetical protein